MDKQSSDITPLALPPKRKDIFYDSGTIKVIVFACLIIVLAVVLTGSISYHITRDAVVDKLKNRDMVYTIESITAKIDGRVERAKETSLFLAIDPTVIQWITGGEQDELLSQQCKAKINNIAQDRDYANAFVVSAITNQYWAEGFKAIQVMSPDSQNDRWFYNALKSGRAIDINIDYNSGRNDTFVFINALVGEVHQPVGVAGVGLSLQTIAEEFRKYKFGENSNLWLVDNNGKIHLSDNPEQNGRNLSDFLPADVLAQVVASTDLASTAPRVIEYNKANGETVDLAVQLTKSTDWKVVFQIPRSESIAILGNIKLNTAIAGLVALLLMVFVFYIVSKQIANPLKRALQLTEKMEKQVEERTRELVEKNQKIIDSIEYAQRLQETILPTIGELTGVFSDYFILWRPRDIVGGDFYWVQRLGDDCFLVAVADCTGHGVPGACMTMAANSVLKQIVNQGITDPACILSEMNRRLKEILYRNTPSQIVDDGLDIGICYVEMDKKLTFAGAKIPLYIYRDNEVHILKGDRKSVGYRSLSNDLHFTNHYWEVQSGDKLYLTTDGYIDQNGGEKDYPLGKKILVQLIQEQGHRELLHQRETFELVLKKYMGNELQRDDITLIGFCIK